MKNKTTILCIMSIAGLLLSLSLYTYFYLSVQSDKKLVATLLEKNHSDTLTLNDLGTIERNLKSTVAIGEKLTMLFVRQESIVDFIQEIESLIKTAGGITGSVDSVSEESSPELDFQNKEDLAVTITAKGDWSGLVKLVGLLENLPYRSTLDSVSFLNAKVEKAPGDAVVDPKQKPVIVKVWQVTIKMHVRVLKTKKTNSQRQQDAQTINDQSDEKK